jgi:hypothetical protein
MDAGPRKLQPVVVIAMRDHLIGYLLGALEPSEHEQVEVQLGRDPHLRRELDLISRCLEPLAADKEHIDPPAGLADRTCEFVAAQAQVRLAPAGGFLRSRWTLADLVVAAGIFFAAATLFFPALNQSRFAARLAGCQNNLRQIGMALTSYSALHNGFFPNVPTDGSLAAAGVYATRLLEHGLISGPQVVVCPASSLADRLVEFRVPTSREWETAEGAQLIQLQRQAGGSYGYNLGYVVNGQYQPTRNLHRRTFAIMADAPNSQPPYHSLNHGGCGQNVLFEDGHVQYLTTCKAWGCNDDIFVNDDGQMAPGLHVNDAVIGTSECRPVVAPVILKIVPDQDR